MLNLIENKVYHACLAVNLDSHISMRISLSTAQTGETPGLVYTNTIYIVQFLVEKEDNIDLTLLLRTAVIIGQIDVKNIFTMLA